MVSTEDLITVARLGLEGDKPKLVDQLTKLAAESSNKNKQKLSKEIKVLLDQHSQIAAGMTVSGFNAGAHIGQSSGDLSSIWLPDSLDKKINHFVEVHKNQSLPLDLKKAYSRMLLYGPPGSGKTTLGYYIAQQLSLPLDYVKVSDVISSKFGETTRNIANIFAKPGRRIIFLDEFDAFGKSRFDNNDVGELKRIVNSLIQTLDFSSDDKIVIGATNMIDSIDPAITRRFNLSVEVDKLDKQEMLDFFEYTLRKNSTIPSKMTRAERKDVVSVFAAIGIQTIDAIKNVYEHTTINAHLNNQDDIGRIDVYSTLLTSGYLNKPSIQVLARSNKKIYQELMTLLADRFKNTDISSYSGLHRNSLSNYHKRTA